MRFQVWQNHVLSINRVMCFKLNFIQDDIDLSYYIPLEKNADAEFEKFSNTLGFPIWEHIAF